MKTLPGHLARYVVDQDYGKYNFVDQAVWRFVLRQLKAFLSKHAHHSYLSGLEKTGIKIERIPRISEISEKLAAFGWRAIPVSGFIPPAAFMELQSLGVLPIASDLRTLEHLMYTPAPDIIHEAAGHAPLIANPEFAQYLREYAKVAKKAILSKQDLEQYGAIRELSDLKESPDSTPQTVTNAQNKLNQISKSMTEISEAAELSRMNWWTVEYGLIGTLKNPKIFGAGLLSSVSESRFCLSPQVRKIPLSLECLRTSYDITEPQPQLFVTPDFATLSRVLEEFAAQMAFATGGPAGLQKALKAQTVNTAQWDSGLQASGVLCEIVSSEGHDACYLRFQGPVQLSSKEKQLPGHDKNYHAQGFGSPVGNLEGSNADWGNLSAESLGQWGLIAGEKVVLNFRSGVRVEGIFEKSVSSEGRVQILTFRDTRVTLGERVLFEPSWGTYDMAVGSRISSVFGGAADPEAYGELESFKAARVPVRPLNEKESLRNSQYLRLRELREDRIFADGLADRLEAYLMTHDQHFPDDWLFRIEALELVLTRARSPVLEGRLRASLEKLKAFNPRARSAIEDGEHLARYL